MRSGILLVHFIVVHTPFSLLFLVANFSFDIHLLREFFKDESTLHYHIHFFLHAEI